MMKRWKLSELQVEAILNMRLRALRRLEEIEIKKELKSLGVEKEELEGLLEDEKRQWKAIGAELEDIKKAFGAGALGERRTAIGCTACRRHCPGRGTGGARAGDGAVLLEGLDPRRQGPRPAARRREVQRG